jgi:hypothetical protein
MSRRYSAVRGYSSLSIMFLLRDSVITLVACGTGLLHRDDIKEITGVVGGGSVPKPMAEPPQTALLIIIV